MSAYLKKHFVRKSEFSSLAGIDNAHLEYLLNIKSIPAATYKCDGKFISSVIFGEIPISETITGEFFRPECVKWVNIALAADTGEERKTVVSALSKELREALISYGISDKVIDEKIQSYLPYFFNGTFGLCIADPSTGTGIAKKEVLQERLIEITEDGSNPTPKGISRLALLKLIEDYAESAMPFSPVEYARSSRKRLVDDLRLIV